MPIRVACPDCAAAVSAPDDAAGTVIRCPKCAAPMELPDAAEVARHRRAAPVPAPDDRPRKRRPARDDEDDYDDRPRRRRRPAGGGFPVWAAVLLGLVLIGVVGGGVYLAVRGKGGAGGGGGLFGGPGRYVPGESEQRLRDLLATKGMSELTEAEVLRAMGEPTIRGPQMTVTINGRTVSGYSAIWQPPNGPATQVVFVDGRVTALNIPGPQGRP